MPKLIRMSEQADAGRDGPRYSWLLEAPYRCRGRLPGWTWISGPDGGCFVTASAELASQTAARLQITIGSNGTHKVSGLPMSLASA